MSEQRNEFELSYIEFPPRPAIEERPLVDEAQATARMRRFKGFCQGRSPEFLQCTKRHARAPLLTAAIGFRCVKLGCT